MAKRHSLLLTLISIVLVLAIIVGVVLVVGVNLTPRQVGLAGAQLTSTYTVEGLGIADVQFGQILKLAKSLTTPQDEALLAPNTFTQEDATATDAKFSFLAVEGKPDYARLFVTSSLILTPMVLTHSQLAYALNTGLNQFYKSDAADLAADYIQAVDVLRRLQASVLEMTFTTENGKYFLKTVFKLNVREYVAEINQNIPQKYHITDYVYCTITNEIDVRTDSLLGIIFVGGVLKQKEFVSVAINDQPNFISEIALNALFKVTAEDGEQPLTVEKISSGICLLLADFCKNIGGIGTVSGATYMYGVQGINCQTKEITFLPRV